MGGIRIRLHMECRAILTKLPRLIQVDGDRDKPTHRRSRKSHITGIVELTCEQGCGLALLLNIGRPVAAPIVVPEHSLECAIGSPGCLTLEDEALDIDIYRSVIGVVLLVSGDCRGVAIRVIPAVLLPIVLVSEVQ